MYVPEVGIPSVEHVPKLERLYLWQVFFFKFHSSFRRVLKWFPGVSGSIQTEIKHVSDAFQSFAAIFQRIPKGFLLS